MAKVDVKITPLPKDEKIDRNWYDVKISTYKDVISGRFEHWELRDLIRKIDNAIF